MSEVYRERIMHSTYSLSDLHIPHSACSENINAKKVGKSVGYATIRTHDIK